MKIFKFHTFFYALPCENHGSDGKLCKMSDMSVGELKLKFNLMNVMTLPKGQGSRLSKPPLSFFSPLCTFSYRSHTFIIIYVKSFMSMYMCRGNGLSG
jgi:hypothetical protein